MLPPDEWHEIGLLFSEYILRSKGIKTIYLGPNVPFDNVNAIIHKIKITHVLTFLIARRNKEDIIDFRKSMSLPASVQLLIAGSHENMEILSNQKNITILKDPNDLLKIL